MNKDYECFLPPFVVNDFNPVMMYSQNVDWGMRLLGIEKLHKLGLTGGGIKCAIIDSGCDIYHKDLKIHYYRNVINDNYDVTDEVGHGTHVAGIIGAQGNDYGTLGVAPDSKISIYKALGGNKGSVLDVAKAIKQAVDDGNTIINMSLGTTADVEPLKRACKYASDRGVTLVVSSGNSGKEEKLYPTSYDTVLSVGSIDFNSMISSFTTFGDFLDVVAPGGRILSTYPNDRYVVMSGTSMAAPYVTGCLILLKQAGVKLTYKNIIQCVRDINDPYFDKKSGYGIIDPNVGINKFTAIPLVSDVVQSLIFHKTRQEKILKRICKIENELSEIKKLMK